MHTYSPILTQEMTWTVRDKKQLPEGNARGQQGPWTKEFLSESRARDSQMDQPRIYSTASTHKQLLPSGVKLALDHSLQCGSHAFFFQIRVSIAVTLFLFKRFWDQFHCVGVGISSTPPSNA